MFTLVAKEEISYGCHVNAVAKRIKSPIITIAIETICKKFNLFSFLEAFLIMIIFDCKTYK